jgi:hypothetical protein
MVIIDKEIKVLSRSEVFNFYPLGDIHIGARHCAEKSLQKVVKEIAENPRAYAIGGGDLLDAVLPTDSKRFDYETLPDWMLEGDCHSTREKLMDILNQQLDRLDSILGRIPGVKWLGCISGNHEFAVKKHTNNDIHKAICNRLETTDLSDEALIRLRFRRPGATAVVILYIRHGYGGGRTPGAEANKIDRMVAEWEIADVCFTGHTHTFRIEPPKPVLAIPRTGRLPAECTCRYRWGANWGCWLYSHPAGKSTTYASRACYPARPMLTVRVEIKPFATKEVKGRQQQLPHIELRQITL